MKQDRVPWLQHHIPVDGDRIAETYRCIRFPESFYCPGYQNGGFCKFFVDNSNSQYYNTYDNKDYDYIRMPDERGRAVMTASHRRLYAF